MAFLTINGVAYPIDRRSASIKPGDQGGAVEPGIANDAGGAVRWESDVHTYTTAPMLPSEADTLRASEGRIVACGGDAFGGVSTDCHVSVTRQYLRDQSQPAGYRVVATITLTAGAPV